MDKELREQIGLIKQEINNICDGFVHEVYCETLAMWFVQRTLEAKLEEIRLYPYVYNIDRMKSLEHQIQQLKDG